LDGHGLLIKAPAKTGMNHHDAKNGRRAENV